MAAKCTHPNLRSFTFSNGEEISRCPDCEFGLGHYAQSIPSGTKLYSSRSTKAVAAEEPEEQDELEQDEIPELTGTLSDISDIAPDEEDEPVYLLPVESDDDSESDQDNDEVFHAGVFESLGLLFHRATSAVLAAMLSNWSYSFISGNGRS